MMPSYGFCVCATLVGVEASGVNGWLLKVWFSNG